VRTLGTAKVLVELAEAMSEIGWEVSFIQPSDVGIPRIRCLAEHELFAVRLGQYFDENASRFDVVDYEHVFLPFSRARFDARPLFVSRSALLVLHLKTGRIPVAPGLRAAVGRVVHFNKRRRDVESQTSRAKITLREADLINLNNSYDKETLVRRGIAANKIAVIPLGLSNHARALFDAVPIAPPMAPIVGFVGTFDYRKGALDFPRIVAALIAAVPDVRFKLLGTAGLFQTADAVKAFFPAPLRPRIEVIPRFEPDALPNLLADVSVGVFPSYVEGFGLGVLEMLAAAVPVIAYDVPGPPMMLPPERLVRAGDIRGVASRAIALLKSPADLAAARIAARESSRRFRWDVIARQTADIYLAAIQRRSSEPEKR
jgi:glycosyltransferase involved in cell wall biosynthesis